MHVILVLFYRCRITTLHGKTSQAAHVEGKGAARVGSPLLLRAILFSHDAVPRPIPHAGTGLKRGRGREETESGIYA